MSTTYSITSDKYGWWYVVNDETEEVIWTAVDQSWAEYMLSRLETWADEEEGGHHD